MFYEPVFTFIARKRKKDKHLTNNIKIKGRLAGFFYSTSRSFINSGILFYQSVSALQAELSSVFALRKRLEWDVLSYQHLRKALEEQISEIRRWEGTRSLARVCTWRAMAELGRSPQASVGDGAPWGFRLGSLLAGTVFLLLFWSGLGWLRPVASGAQHVALAP